MLEVNAENLPLNNLTALPSNALLGKIGYISFNSTIQEIDRDNFQIIQYPQDSKLSLSALINNALLGQIGYTPFNSTSLDQVKEQFITINPDKYNENLIFEQKDKKIEVITTKVPFILPVPFP
jgi:hypothetical protein